MPGYPASHQPNAARNFLARLHSHILRFIIPDVNATAFVERQLAFDLRPVLLREEINPDRGAAFLAGLGQEIGRASCRERV